MIDHFSEKATAIPTATKDANHEKIAKLEPDDDWR
jgi:hypothetical protein